MLQINITEGSNIPKIEKARIPIATEDKRNKKTNLNKDFSSSSRKMKLNQPIYYSLCLLFVHKLGLRSGINDSV